MKLQHKSSLLFFVIGITFLITVSTIYYYQSRNLAVANAQLSSLEITEEYARRVEEHLEKDAHIASTLANSPVIEQSLTLSNSELSRLSEEEREQNISRLNKKWMEIKDVNNPFIQSYMTNPVATYLKKQQALFPDFYGEIFLTNSYGVIIATTKKLTTLAHAHKYWWIDSYYEGKGKIFFDDRGYDKSVKGYVLGVVVPVKKGDKIIGILKANIKILGPYSHLLDEFTEKKPGTMSLARSKGLIVFEKGLEPLSRKLSGLVIEKMKNPVSNSLITTLDGTKQIISYAPVSVSKGSEQYVFGGKHTSIDHIKGNLGEGWFVIVSRDIQDALAASESLTQRILLIGLVFTLIIAAIALLFGRSISKPIIKLIEMTKNIGKGDFKSEIEISSKDELGVLEKSFNNMLARLRETTTSRDKLLEEISQRKQAEENVTIITNAVSIQIGEAFFQSLVVHLAKLFDVKYTFIGLVDEQRPNMIDTIALCVHGEVVDNLSYELAHTPCEHVVGSSSSSIRSYPRDLQKLFPDSLLLEEMGAESYVGAPLADSSGKPIGLIVVMDNKPMESTKMVETILKVFAIRAAAELERLRGEQVLRNSEAGLAEAQRMAHIGSWELDLVTNQLEWSEEIYRIFEIDQQKFGASYKAFLDTIHQDDREQVNTAYTESVKNKMPYGIEHRLQMQDGSIKHVQEYCETFYDNEDNPIRSVGTIQDITERYQAEQSLKRLNRSLQALSACNEVLVRAADEEELLNKVCRIIVKISGYRLAWVGFTEHDEAKTIRPVAESGYNEGYLDSLELTWADTERGQGPTGVAIRTGKPSIIRNILEDPRYTLWRQSAQEHGYSSSIALPLKNKEQTFGALNIYACEEDAFDEKEIQFLQELADDLAFGLVTLRSHSERHQLNRQLQQAQKMEAIGQLTGGIAHDFNNILASILGFTSLALQRFVKDDQPELREYLNEVSHAGERARDLVSQMLAFSRKGSSKVTLLQISPMIKEVTKMLQATLPSSIQLSSQVDADVPAVMMDPVQLQQVLMNMCINARDAMSGKGRIDIRVHRIHFPNRDQYTVQAGPNGKVLRNICDACHNEIEEGDYVELSVQDVGTGINDDQLKRIFEPFFTTKDVGKGTGMGLSIMHGIVHDYGGHILVDTQPGIGTTFRLLLPVGEDVPTHETLTKIATRPITEGLNNARILIVDDEESVARFMGDLLESRGGNITVMTDSQTALDLFSQEPAVFDLVITDQTMPGLTGMELSQKVLALRPELPVILCTGYSEHVDEAKAMALGIRGYLTKPMEVSALFNLVRCLI